jgi:hypothetical protein
MRAACKHGRYESHMLDAPGWDEPDPSCPGGRDITIDYEAVAAVEHEQWEHWTRTLVIAEHELSTERIERWQDYWVPYDELPDDVKESDRKWARKAVAAAIRDSESAADWCRGGHTIDWETAQRVLDTTDDARLVVAAAFGFDFLRNVAAAIGA